MPRKFIDIVIAFHDESQNLKVLVPKLLKTIKKIKHHRFRLIFINDGSMDDGRLVINKFKMKRKNIFLISHSKRLGQTYCYKSYLKKFKTEYFIRMDADNQDNPKYIKNISKFILKDCDLILTDRKSRQHSKINMILGIIYNKIMPFFAKVKLHNYTSSLVCFKREFIPYKNLMLHDHRYLPVIAINNGAKKIKSFDVLHGKRILDVSKYNANKKVIFAFPEFVFFILRLKMGFYVV